MVSYVFHDLSSANCKALFCVKISFLSDAHPLCKSHSGLEILGMTKLGMRRHSFLFLKATTLQFVTFLKSSTHPERPI